MKNVEKFVSLWPLITAIIIACGFIKLNIFYGYHGIEIINYISTAEILTHFLGDIIIIVIIVISPLLAVIKQFTSQDTDEIKIRQDEQSKVYKKVIEDLKSIHPDAESILQMEGKRKKDWYVIISRILSPILIVLFIYFASTEHSIWKYDFYRISTFLIPILLLLSISNTRLSPTNPLLTYIIVVLMFHTIIQGVVDISKVKNDYRYINTIVEFNDSKFTGDSTKYYIGNTKEFIFFYNSKTKKSDVFQMSDVKRITFSNKN